MPKPFDATTKRLVESHPADWLALLGISGTDIEPLDAEIVDADLATVSLAADRVLRIKTSAPGLVHIEFESGHHGNRTPDALLRYSVLLTGKYELPVHSAVVLLRKEADSPSSLIGRLEYQNVNGTPYLAFSYSVIRVWDLPVEPLLAGGIGTLPLAPLARVSEQELPDIVRRMEARIAAEASSEEGLEIWASVYILMGLRYPSVFTNNLLKGVRQMKESVTYQAILEEGEAKGRAEGRSEGLTLGEIEGERRMLLRQGTRRFGEPSPKVQEEIAAISSSERLIELGVRLLEVENWAELLAEG